MAKEYTNRIGIPDMVEETAQIKDNQSACATTGTTRIQLRERGRSSTPYKNLCNIFPIALFALVSSSAASEFLPNGCPSDFSIHHLFAHESDCDKYYMCSNGQKFLMPCGAGTFFDVESQTCNWDYLVDCSRGKDEPSSPAPQGFLPNGCPQDFSIHLLLPHETDCDKFYQCSNGHKFLMPCAYGTQFDFKLQVCNFPYLVECSSNINSSETTEAGIIPTTEDPLVPPKDYLENGCPADFSLELLLPHETECNRFYQCSNGNKVSMQCATGTVFDFGKQECDWPHLVVCNILSTTSKPTTITTEQTEYSTYSTTAKPEITNSPITTVLPVTTTTLPEISLPPVGTITPEAPVTVTTPEYIASTELETTEKPVTTTDNIFITESDSTPAPISNFTTIEPEIIVSPDTFPEYTTTLEPETSYPSVTVPDYTTVREPETTVPTDVTLESEATKPSTIPEYTTILVLETETTTSPDITSDYTISTETEGTESPVTIPDYTTAKEPNTTEPTAITHLPEPEPTVPEYTTILEPETTVSSDTTSGYTLSTGTEETDSPVTIPDYTTVREPDTSEPTGITDVPEATKPEPAIPEYTTKLESETTASPDTTSDYTTSTETEVSESPVTIPDYTTVKEPEATVPTDITVEPDVTDPSPTTPEHTTILEPESTASPDTSDFTTSTDTEVTESPVTIPDYTTGKESETTVPTDITVEPEVTDAGLTTPEHTTILDPESTASPDTTSDYTTKTETEVTESPVTIPDYTTVKEPEATVPTDTTVEPEVTDPGPTTSEHTTLSEPESTASPDTTSDFTISTETEVTESPVTIPDYTTIREPDTTIPTGITQVPEISTEPTIPEYTTILEPETTVSSETTYDSTVMETETTLSPDTTSDYTATDVVTMDEIDTTATTEWEQITTPAICPPGSSGNVPHSESCTEFYLCLGGIPVPLFCSNGEEFDAELGRCVEITEGGCTLGQTSTTNPASTLSTILASSYPTVTDAIVTTQQPITVYPETEITESISNTDFTDSGMHETTTETQDLIISTENTIINEIPTDMYTDSTDTTKTTEPDISVPSVTTTDLTNTTEPLVTTPNYTTVIEFETTVSPDHTVVLDTETTEQPNIIPDYTSAAEPDTTVLPDTIPDGTTSVETEITEPPNITSDYTTDEGLYTTDPTMTTSTEEKNTVTSFTTEYSVEPDTTMAITTSETDVIGTTEWIQTTTPVLCPPGSSGNVAHPESCTEFYMCLGGIPVPLFCSEGEEFDVELGRCIEIVEGGCTLGQISTSYPEFNTTISNSVSTEVDPISVTTVSAITEYPETEITESISNTYYTETDETTTETRDTTILNSTEGSLIAETTSEVNTDTTSDIISTINDTEITEQDMTTFTDTNLGITDTPESESSEPSATFSDLTTILETQTTISPEITSDYITTLQPEVTQETDTATGATIESDSYTTQDYMNTLEPDVSEESATNSDLTSIKPDIPDTTLDYTSPESEVTVPPVSAPNYTTIIVPDNDITPDYTNTIEPEQTEPPVTSTDFTIVSSSETQATEPPSSTPDDTSNEELNTTESPTATSLIENTTPISSSEYATTVETDPTTEVTSEIAATTTDIQTTTPVICPPGTSGNVPHPESCTEFYMCFGGISVPLYCSDGEEFDAELGRCVEITDGGCTYGQTSTSSSYSTTDSYAITTDQTTAADTETNISEADISNMTTDMTSITTVAEITTEIYTDFTTVITSTADNTINKTEEYNTEAAVKTTTNIISTDSSEVDVTETDQTTTVSSDTTASTLCPLGVSNYVPDPESCYTFYKCLDGMLVPLYCSDGEEFDPDQGICVDIIDGGCTLGQISTSDSNDVTVEYGTTAGIKDTTPESHATSSESSDTNFTTDHSTSLEEVFTTEFIRTTDDAAVEEEDKGNTESIRTEITILTTAVSSYNTSSDPTDEPSTENEIIDSTITVADDIENDFTTEAFETTTTRLCPPGSSGNVPNFERCDGFYMCFGGSAFPFYCSEGFEFDSESEGCVEIAPGGCTLEESTTFSAETDSTSVASSSNVPIIISPGSPGSAFSTEHTATTEKPDSIPEESEITEEETNLTTDETISESDRTSIVENTDSTTDALGFATDDTESATDDKQSTEETVSTTETVICADGVSGHVAHPELCDRFYLCIGGTAIPLYCGDGFEYDSESQRCVAITEDGCSASRGLPT